jgi:putative tricarboxylic transport membrane protein
MARREWILYLALLISGIVVIRESLHHGLGDVHKPGTGFLPFFSAAALSLVALYCLIKNLFIAASTDAGKAEKFFGQYVANVVIIVVALGVYVLVLPWLGYVLCTFFLFILLFKIGGFRKWSYIVLASLLTVSSSYLLFSSWLSMRFPKGFLGF